MTMRLLLINPKFPDSFWSFKWAVTEVLPNKRTTNPPLGLATLAALCPSDWEVEIIDENVEPVPLEPKADLIGICGMGVQFSRQTRTARRTTAGAVTKSSRAEVTPLCVPRTTRVLPTS